MAEPRKGYRQTVSDAIDAVFDEDAAKRAASEKITPIKQYGAHEVRGALGGLVAPDPNAPASVAYRAVVPPISARGGELAEAAAQAAKDASFDAAYSQNIEKQRAADQKYWKHKAKLDAARAAAAPDQKKNAEAYERESARQFVHAFRTGGSHDPNERAMTPEEHEDFRRKWRSEYARVLELYPDLAPAPRQAVKPEPEPKTVATKAQMDRPSPRDRR
jgi:hypothetical protein